MGGCEYCGYWWQDIDEDGTPLNNGYCHFVGPDDWAPCADNNEYEEDNDEADYAAYEQWLHDETQRELDEGWPEQFM